MKVTLLITGILLIGALVSCGTVDPSILQEHSGEYVERIIWVGFGESYLYIDEEWQRSPSFDYSFIVKQNRLENRWESHKIQNRTASDYDGLAGPADQQHSFIIQYHAEEEGRIPFDLTSTYGNGGGIIDADLRFATMQFSVPDAGFFSPYNQYRISQEYDYERGTLVETVELFLLDKAGNEVPYAKIEERAVMYR